MVDKKKRKVLTLGSIVNAGSSNDLEEKALQNIDKKKDDSEYWQNSSIESEQMLDRQNDAIMDLIKKNESKDNAETKLDNSGEVGAGEEEAIVEDQVNEAKVSEEVHEPAADQESEDPQGELKKTDKSNNDNSAEQIISNNDSKKKNKKNKAKFAKDIDSEEKHVGKKVKASKSRKEKNVIEDDEIDIKEYESLYGDNINIVSSSTGKLVPVPVKKKRVSSGKALTSKTNTVKQKKPIEYFNEMTVGDIANLASLKIKKVFRVCKSLEIEPQKDTYLDWDEAELLSEELGFTLVDQKKDAEVALIEDALHNQFGDEFKIPVITILGHVDHGKTSLLDAVRKSNIAHGEDGGITQHLGSYLVETELGDIMTFIDTPGHTVFNSMRRRGAHLTDVAVLIVAADDGVKPQTQEAIKYLKEAGTPFVVAINKIDKNGANVDRVKMDLMQYDIVSEDIGGEVIFQEISAKTGQGVIDLLHKVKLLSDSLDLKCDPASIPKGFILESKIDKRIGAISVLLIENGSLKKGDMVVTANGSGRVRKMVDDIGEELVVSQPGIPAEVIGINGKLSPGDRFVVVPQERFVVKIQELLRQEYEQDHATLDQIKDSLFAGFNAATKKKLNIIIKADFVGSSEAIEAMLKKIESNFFEVNIIKAGIGSISESDFDVAKMAEATIFGFNVEEEVNVRILSAKSNVSICHFSNVYELEKKMKEIIADILPMTEREEVIGAAEVKKMFEISKFGTVAGCLVTKGSIKRNLIAKVIRDGQEVGRFKINSLKQNKDEVKESNAGRECGIHVTNPSVIINEGDLIQAVEVVQEKRVIENIFSVNI